MLTVLSLQAELNKEDFVPPPGWKWDSDWYISPDLRYFTTAVHYSFTSETSQSFSQETNDS